MISILKIKSKKEWLLRQKLKGHFLFKNFMKTLYLTIIGYNEGDNKYQFIGCLNS